MELLDAPKTLRDSLATGAAKARVVADETMAGVREHMGYLIQHAEYQTVRP